MNWVFIVVALNGPMTVAESVHLESREQCIAYAEGRTSKLGWTHTVLCVDKRYNRILDLKGYPWFMN